MNFRRTDAVLWEDCGVSGIYRDWSLYSYRHASMCETARYYYGLHGLHADCVGIKIAPAKHLKLSSITYNNCAHPPALRDAEYKALVEDGRREYWFEVL